MLYSFDEATGALQFSHKIELQTKHMLSILFVFFLMQFEQHYHTLSPNFFTSQTSYVFPDCVKQIVENINTVKIICMAR